MIIKHDVDLESGLRSAAVRNNDRLQIVLTVSPLVVHKILGADEYYGQIQSLLKDLSSSL